MWCDWRYHVGQVGSISTAARVALLWVAKSGGRLASARNSACNLQWVCIGERTAERREERCDRHWAQSRCGILLLHTTGALAWRRAVSDVALPTSRDDLIRMRDGQQSVHHRRRARHPTASVPKRQFKVRTSRQHKVQAILLVQNLYTTQPSCAGRFGPRSLSLSPIPACFNKARQSLTAPGSIVPQSSRTRVAELWSRQLCCGCSEMRTF